jgi:hypothetical protein
VARKPSAVGGTTINFSAFSWAVRSLGNDARNQARDFLISATPEIKMGVLLGRCLFGHAGVRHVGVYSGVDTRAAQRPGHVTRHASGGCLQETTGSDMSERLAVSLSSPLGFCGATGVTTTAAHVIPPSGDSSCWSPESIYSPVESGDCCSSGVGPAPVAGRQVAGSDQSA